MKLLPFFNRKSKQNVLTYQVRDDFEIPVPTHCYRAYACETHQFDMNETGILIWQRAIQNPETFTWSVMEITKRPGGAGILQNITKVTSAQNIDFFKAIATLAAFERGENAIPGHDIQPYHSKDEIDKPYFKDLAREEGVAFDVKGIPFPTVSGLLAIPAEYPDGEEERVKTAITKALGSQNSPIKTISPLFVGSRSVKNQRFSEAERKWKSLLHTLEKTLEDMKWSWSSPEHSLTAFENLRYNSEYAEKTMLGFINEVIVCSHIAYCRHLKHAKKEESCVSFIGFTDHAIEAARRIAKLKTQTPLINDDCIEDRINALIHGDIDDVDNIGTYFYPRYLDAKFAQLKAQIECELEEGLQNEKDYVLGRINPEDLISLSDEDEDELLRIISPSPTAIIPRFGR